MFFPDDKNRVDNKKKNLEFSFSHFWKAKKLFLEDLKLL